MAKHFISGGLDADSAPHLLQPGDFINMENGRFLSTDAGSVGMLEGIRASLERSAGLTLPVGTNTCIGACADAAGQYVVWFVHNDGASSAIYLYHVPSSTSYTVLTDADITDGLGFSRDALVEARIVNDWLYFTDGLNEPRKVNLSAAISGHATTGSLVNLVVTVGAFISSGVDAGKQPVTWTFTVPSGTSVVSYDYKLAADPAWTTANAVTPPAVGGYSPRTFNIPAGTYQYRILVYYFDNRPFETYYPGVADRVVSPLPVAGWYYKFPAKRSDITLIRQPPVAPPTVTKAVDGSFVNNYIKYTSFQFALQYVYFDGEVTPLSLRSRSTFLNPKDQSYNQLLLTLPTDPIPQGVRLVRIIAIHDGTAYVAKTWDYNVSGDLFGDPTSSSTSSLAFGFYNTDKGETIDSALLAKPFDSVPTLSQTIELVKNRFFLGNNTEGYNTPVSSSLSATTTIDTLTSGIFDGSSDVFHYFKSNSSYRLGIVFYDRFMRHSGVYTNDTLNVHTPGRTFDLSGGVRQISWTLSNTTAFTEIPDWAYYYSIVVTRNLQYLSFIQGKTGEVKYAFKQSDGTNTYSDTYSAETAAVAIPLKEITRYGLGYTYTANDAANIILTTDAISSHEVIGIYDSYVWLSPKNLGASLTGTVVLYELFTPYTGSESAFFYETGAVYSVLTPTTDTRTYGTVSGGIEADAFAVKRLFSGGISYWAEAMCPNDDYWTRWDSNRGRVKVVETIGQAQKKTGLRYSDVYVPGTSLNGLCTFEALNEQLLPLEMGSLQKLVLTSKSQTDGSVLLGIGETETCSIYIGEAQMSDGDGNTFLVRTTGVIGQVNVLQGSYGTVNPESVAAFGGRVFWFDALSGVVVSYSNNGLFPVSDKGAKRAVRLFAASYLAQRDVIEANYSCRPFVFGGIDPYHKEYLLSAPKTEYNPPKGALTDYGLGMDYPYDIYDGKAKTWVYAIEADRWMGAHTYTVDYFVEMGDALYGLRGGGLHGMGAGTGYNNFFGTNVKTAVMLVENGQPDDSMKEFTRLIVEANTAPGFTHIRTELPNVQSSDVADTDFTVREGIYYAPLLRDRLSPNVSGSANAKLLTGDTMRGQWAMLWMQWDTQSLLQVRSVSVGYVLSGGQKKLVG